MNLFGPVVNGQRELLWVLLGLAAAALAFRLVRPHERRALRMTWVLVALALAAHAQDLAVAIFSLAWCLLWLRLSGVDPSQLFTTSALITAIVAFSMQDTLGNVLGGVALQLEVAAIAERRISERNERMAHAGTQPAQQGDLLARVLNFFSLASSG